MGTPKGVRPCMPRSLLRQPGMAPPREHAAPDDQGSHKRRHRGNPRPPQPLKRAVPASVTEGCAIWSTTSRSYETRRQRRGLRRQKAVVRDSTSSRASRHHLDLNNSDTPTSAFTFDDNITYGAAKTAAAVVDH